MSLTSFLHHLLTLARSQQPSSVPAVTALELPDGSRLSCQLRQHPRNRHLRLRFSPNGDRLILSAPAHISAVRLEAFLQRNLSWIMQHHRPAASSAPILPTHIRLTAIDQQWQIHPLAPTTPPSLKAQAQAHEQTLALAADPHAPEQWQPLLRQWLSQQAIVHLPPLLHRLSQQTGLNYRQVSIRQQRTRWGSCSAQGNISLNARLLLLPPDWVRHVLLHELCHTVELNHSPRFWALLRQHDPDTDHLRQLLKQAEQRLPDWAR